MVLPDRTQLQHDGTTHCWVENWGVYGPLSPSQFSRGVTDLSSVAQLNSSQANLEAAKTFARSFIANSSQWAAEIGKPVFLEEFGMARNNWENVDKEYQYLSSAGTSNKDEYFEVSLLATPVQPESTANDRTRRQSSEQQ
jgi:mannan endo-1,4-beta-mannosidase